MASIPFLLCLNDQQYDKVSVKLYFREGDKIPSLKLYLKCCIFQHKTHQLLKETNECSGKRSHLSGNHKRMQLQSGGRSPRLDECRARVRLVAGWQFGLNRNESRFWQRRRLLGQGGDSILRSFLKAKQKFFFLRTQQRWKDEQKRTCRQTVVFSRIFTARLESGARYDFNNGSMAGKSGGWRGDVWKLQRWISWGRYERGRWCVWEFYQQPELLHELLLGER